ncbi:uncharacterized protein PHALS_01144 [Plasmopara halstedii]|uniref:Uncharacterized protein n=1 Tax=Plasmopara halstedii TaxID=4781 RepID=A0A0P1AUS4_PLAHL|nr:uncharacterized protein PHALS_01144 [Plasmopara halstedii]CEG44808.1 hypothetical protein PHALS_01144 [Plasmopara halstedii]|eukprot:XP_024581177.1 hypothetical protein PHALS_01144 [Plasmopara halstedii]
MSIIETLDHVQQGMNVHTSTSRSILLHICQRLTRLEANVSKVCDDVLQLRQIASEGSNPVGTEVSANVISMSTKLREHENVMEIFKKDMRAHQNHLSILSTKVEKGTEHIDIVDTKVEDHRQDVINRFVELTQNLRELPMQLTTLQTIVPTSVNEKFTFQTNDDKLSLQTHLQRLETHCSKGYTDLQPFTIPDDMKVKVEARIRQQATSKRQADAQAAAELSDAYRRLQLAAVNSNNPRLSQLYLSLDQCQHDVKQAFQLIRSSNLQLHSYCESKAERSDVIVFQSELKQLRNRIRKVENASLGIRPKSQILSESTNSAIDELKVGNGALSCKKGPSQLTISQVPVLRVSLLELSRNFNLLQHRWKKHKRLHPNSGTSINPLAQKHLEKVVAIINDAYASLAQEPVDLINAEIHVDKVSRVLSSDYSMQTLALLGRHSDEFESCRFPLITGRAAAGEMAAALCKYAEAFTAMFFRHEADQKVVTSALNEWTSEKQTLENINRQVSALARRQQILESALDKLVADGKKRSENMEAECLSENQSLPTRLMNDEMQHLKAQLDAMNNHFVTEVEVLEIIRTYHDEQQSKLTGIDRVNIKHRKHINEGSTPSLSLDSSSSAPLLRPYTVDNDSSAHQKFAGFTFKGHEDRPRAQTKLDPLQGVKMRGSTRRFREKGLETITSRLPTQAQMLCPTTKHTNSDD